MRGRKRTSRAFFRILGAAAAAAYLGVLASAAPHQVHHAAERLAEHLGGRPPADPHDHHLAGHDDQPKRHPRGERPAHPRADCALASALAWKGAELPAAAPSGAPAPALQAMTPPAPPAETAFLPLSLPIRAPPRAAVS